MTSHYRTTITDMASVLAGRPIQIVSVVKTVTSTFGAKHLIVSVNGEWFVVYADATLRALRNGWTPQELELEPAPDDDEQDDDDFCMNTGVYPRASGWRGMK